MAAFGRFLGNSVHCEQMRNEGIKRNVVFLKIGLLARSMM